MISKPETPHADNLLLHYGYMLLKRRFTILAFAATLTITVLIHSLLATKIFSATAIIEISPKAPVVMDVRQVSEMVPQSMGQIQNYYETQYEIIKSDSVLARAVDALRQQGVTDFDKAKRPTAALRGKLTIVPRSGTHLVTLSAEDADAEKAALFVNTVTQAYMDSNLERSLGASKQALEWLKQQQSEYRKAQIASDERVQNFRSEHNLIAVDGGHYATSETLEKLQTALSDAHTRRVIAEATHTELTRLKRRGGLALATHLARTNDVLQALLTRLEQLREERTRLTARYRAEHPEVQRNSAEIRGLESQIRAQVSTLIDGQQAELDLAIREEQELNVELVKIEQQISKLGDDINALKFLEHEAQRNRQFYQSLDQRMAEVGLSQFMQANNVRIVDKAVPAETPIRPMIAVNVATALLAGLIGGAAIALLLETIDGTIQSREDVEHGIGIPLLGVVPRYDETQVQQLKTERDRSVIVHSLQRSNIAECLRTVRTNIVLRSNNKPLRRVLVTSAAPREGKSFISTNLAAILAMNGTRVLAIDGDLRRPALHKRFQLPNELGLANVLAGEIGLTEAIQPTHVAGLHLLVAGPTPINPSETLGFERMRALLDSIRGYDLVLIDSPPMNVVADALVLASLADAAVFIIESGITSRKIAQKSCERLAEVNPNLLGAVVNKVDVRGAGYSYYYYYSDYSYYNADNQDPKKASPSTRSA